jgi:hypothetical protein
MEKSRISNFKFHGEALKSFVQSERNNMQ